MRPSVGLRPNTPQKCEGMRMEPPMSLPTSSELMPEATATAPPPELPPQVRSTSHGLFVRPKMVLCVCVSSASRGMFVLPTMTAPAALSRATTVASRSGMWRASASKPLVVRSPVVSKASLMVRGTPCKGPHTSPRASAASASRARARARPSSSVTRALSRRLLRAIWPRCASRSSTADTSRQRTRSAIWCVERKASSCMARTLAPNPGVPPLLQAAREVADDEARTSRLETAQELADAHGLATRALVPRHLQVLEGIDAERARLHLIHPVFLDQPCERIRLALPVGDPGEEQEVERQVGVALARERDGGLHVFPAVLHRLVISLVQVLHRRVERHAHRVQARVEERLEAVGEARVGVDVDGAARGVRAHVTDGLGDVLPARERLALTALAEADHGAARRVLQVVEPDGAHLLGGGAIVHALVRCGRPVRGLIRDATHAARGAHHPGGDGALVAHVEDVLRGEAAVEHRARGELLEHAVARKARQVRVHELLEFRRRGLVRLPLPP